MGRVLGWGKEWLAIGGRCGGVWGVELVDMELALNAIARTAAITAIAVLALLLLVGAASHDVLMALEQSR
jgi:hypothetical protein